jgi:predicted Zn-dependent protease
MSIDAGQVRYALDKLGPGTTLDIADESAGLLRYANSRVTAQHGEQRLRVRARVNRDGQAVSATLDTLDRAAVDTLAGKLSDAMSVLTARSAGAPTTTPLHADAESPMVTPVPSEATLSATAGDRYDWFRTVRDGLGDATLGGSVRHEVLERVVADHDGLYRSETLTKASMQAIAERDGHTTFRRLLDRDAAKIDVGPVAEQLRAGLRDLPVRDTFSGTCRVYLRPQAALNLLATYGYAVLGAAGYAAGRTAVAGRMGEQVAGELVTLRDDGTDPAGLPSGFDVEGTPRRDTPLLTNGKLVGVVSDLARAGVTGGVPTGHGVPLAWRFGADPAPSHLLADAGTATEDELIQTLGEGLVVTRLDYLRVLHPKDTLVTGTTRDATYWVRDGRIVAWHPSVRFTFRLDEVLRNVLAVGADRERGDTPFMESAVSPGLVVDAGPFTQ